MSAVLRQSGYEVLAAGTGTEALELLETSQVDLLILDIMMPKLDGFSACKEIKKEKKQVANIEEHWGEIASSRECQLTDEDLQILKDFIKDL